MAKPGGGIMAVFVVVTALVLLASADDGQHRREAPSLSSSKKSQSQIYAHTWPELEVGWRIVVGSIMAFCGAAFGSVGGVGGGGIFVPMLTLVIGFDTKSSAAISKCMIVGAAASTVYYNIRQRHPSLDMPIIDYDLALLFQPMLVLGISIGVTLNVILADWMVTVILIILCLVTSTMAFFKGIRKWKNETTEKVNERESRSNELDTRTSNVELENNSLPGGSTKHVSFIKNVHWRKLGIIILVWIAILALQIIKFVDPIIRDVCGMSVQLAYILSLMNQLLMPHAPLTIGPTNYNNTNLQVSYTSDCSTVYWVLNALQIPVVVAASGYEAMKLYKRKAVIASRGERGTHFKVRQLVFYCVMGVVAGTIGGTVGLGGGVIMGPMFLQMGVPPQVSSATATFAMLFSSSMSVVEYYLLKRFPIPYTLYFVGVTTIAALVGQYVVKKVIQIVGRVSIVIFVLSLTVFVSAFLIGGQGIDSMVKKIHHHTYMGFQSLCPKH